MPRQILEILSGILSDVEIFKFKIWRNPMTDDRVWITAKVRVGRNFFEPLLVWDGTTLQFDSVIVGHADREFEGEADDADIPTRDPEVGAEGSLDARRETVPDIDVDSGYISDPECDRPVVAVDPNRTQIDREETLSLTQQFKRIQQERPDLLED